MKTDRPTTRAGFTMIELLITITLIAIMTSIMVSLVRGVIGSSRQAATKATIVKISRMMEERVEAFHRYIQKLDLRAGDEWLPRYVKPLHLQQAGDSRKLAMILARKDEFRRQFPQIFSEDDGNNSQNWPQNDPNFIPYGPFSEDTNKNGTLDSGEDLNNNGQLDLHDIETESAECLYHFLMQGETFGSEPITADAFTSNEFQDTDGDGLMEFVDSWGKPLRFYRWPTRLIRPNRSLMVGDPPDWQTITNENNSVMLQREFKFKIDETAAAVIFGPLSPAPASVIRLPLDNRATLLHELDDPLSRDGDDPLGLTFRPKNTLPDYDYFMSPMEFEKRYHTASTYHVPLVLSVGSDGELGMYEPYEGTFTPHPTNASLRRYYDTNFGRLAQPIIDPISNSPDEALFDNISNIFLRSGVSR